MLDTNVLVAALRSDGGASRRILASALDREIDLLISVPLLIEYEAVLSRPEHLTACGLRLEEVGTLLDALLAVAEPVRLRFLWRPQLKDPADEMVLETAVNGGAERLVTFNLRHLESAAKRFGILAANPPQFWEEIGSHAKK